MHYWLATVRRDGSPHVVPVDGMWLDGCCYVGGDTATVHIQNLRRDGRATLHLEDGESAVIVEGVAEWVTPSKAVALRLAAAAQGQVRLFTDGCLVPRRRVAAAADQSSGLEHAVRRRNAIPLQRSRLI